VGNHYKEESYKGNNCIVYLISALRGPHLWVQEVALLRYLSYPMPVGITRLPGLNRI
jgi:hypothetical protein